MKRTEQEIVATIQRLRRALDGLREADAMVSWTDDDESELNDAAHEFVVAVNASPRDAAWVIAARDRHSMLLRAKAGITSHRPTGIPFTDVRPHAEACLARAEEELREMRKNCAR